MEGALRAASVITTIVLACGFVLWIVEPGGRRVDLVLDSGLVLLMAMPVVQLIRAIAEEVRAKEWRFAIIGAAVLLLICGSVVISLQW